MSSVQVYLKLILYFLLLLPHYLFVEGSRITFKLNNYEITIESDGINANGKVTYGSDKTLLSKVKFTDQYKQNG